MIENKKGWSNTPILDHSPARVKSSSESPGSLCVPRWAYRSPRRDKPTLRRSACPANREGWEMVHTSRQDRSRQDRTTVGLRPSGPGPPDPDPRPAAGLRLRPDPVGHPGGPTPQAGPPPGPGDPDQLRRLAEGLLRRPSPQSRPGSRPSSRGGAGRPALGADRPTVHQPPEGRRLHQARAGGQARPRRPEEPDGLAVLLQLRAHPGHRPGRRGRAARTGGGRAGRDGGRRPRAGPTCPPPGGRPGDSAVR